MAYDVVINVGLGVYDGSMRLLVEQGAHNSARGADAAGNAPLSPKQEEGPDVLQVGSMAPSTSAVDGLVMGDYTVEAVNARPRNSYICNDTHFRALKALQHAQSKLGCGRLQAVYFIHIPKPDKSCARFANSAAEKAWEKGEDLSEGTDYGPLARAMATLIQTLVLHTVTGSPSAVRELYLGGGGAS